MHEASLLRGLMRQLQDIAAARGAVRITAVSVRLGALSQMSPAHFTGHFHEAARGTIAEGAALRAVVSEDFTDPRADGVWLEDVEIEQP